MNVGDKVKIRTKKGEFEGVYMPSTSQKYEVIKLDSGYNMGILKKNVEKIEVVGKRKEIKKKKVSEVTQKKGLPTVTILHTGGTIASKVDYETGATFSSFTPEDILAMFPEIAEYANVRSRLIGNMWSQDMRFAHYNVMAKEIEKEIKAGVDGVIVTQGTDTMHYTSAALSFVLEGLNVPVLVVGAQKSSDRGSSDAYVNLINAVYFMTHSDFAEVGICMHATMDDEDCHILPGTKVRKLNTFRRDAFRPVNTVPWARVNYLKDKISWIKEGYISRSVGGLKLKLFNEKIKVAILKQHTNMFAEQFAFYEKYDGLVIEATGPGCLPITELDESTAESGKILKAISGLIKKGVVVVEAAQAIYGRIILNVYSDQRVAQQCGVLGNFSDMTSETTFIKLAWLLSNYKKSEVGSLVGKNLRGELSERVETRTFLY